MGFRRRFTVEGLNLERFMQAAAQAGAQLTNVRRESGRLLTAVTEERAMPTLATLADEGGWLLTPGERIGAGRAADALRRRCFAVTGMIMIVFLCFVASGMCWQIEFIDAAAYEADLRAALADMGIRAPRPRSGIDLVALQDALEWRYPEVAWFECGWRGVTLTVRAVQGNVKSAKAGESAPCNVVASQDGVVQQIVTRAGTPLVKTGDTVRAGQVLIEGVERTSSGEMKPVAARGSVYARVWVEAAVKTPLHGTETIPTGNERTRTTVICPWFSLWRAGEADFANQDVHAREMPLGGLFIPFAIRSETMMETDLRSAERDFKSVLEENERAAVQKLLQITAGRDSLVDNWVNWSIIEDEILLSVATGEMLVDIAQQERSSDMAASD